MRVSSVSKALFTPDEPSTWKPWLIGSAAAGAFLLVALGLMALTGLLDIPADDTGAKTLAAALGLVGAVLTAAVTLVGTVVKYSIDDRSARLAAIESARNYALAIDAEKRNRIEAAIRAVDLLGENNRNATEHQIGGALLALVNLGELDLAVALLNELWPQNLAPPSVAEVVLNRALASDSADTQVSASTVVFQNAHRIGLAGYHIWPLPDTGWRTDLPGECRLALVRAAAKWMKVELAGDKVSIPTAAEVLFKALEDPDDYVKELAAHSLRPVAKRLEPGRWMYGGGKRISVKEILEAAAEVPNNLMPDLAAQWESEIDQLMSEGPEPAKKGRKGKKRR